MNRLIIFHVLVLLAFFGIAPHWSILAGVVLSFVLKLSVADRKSCARKTQEAAPRRQEDSG